VYDILKAIHSAKQKKSSRKSEHISVCRMDLTKDHIIKLMYNGCFVAKLAQVLMLMLCTRDLPR